MASTRISELQDQLQVALARAENWTRSLDEATVLTETSLPGGPDNANVISLLRARAASTLIKIAMFGAFSSGKSFLLSGLQGHLSFLEVKSAGHRPSPKYIGLLPTAPQPTSSCPVQVIPVADAGEVDASGTGFMRVRFIGSEEWEPVGNSPAPAVVAAYVMHNADPTNRLRHHWDREVAEVEILLSEFEIPGTLWDLPGYGSPVKAHDAIVHAAVNDADCFIYVSRASRTLGDLDLDLIRSLYDHCLALRKKVIWVLAGKDQADSLDLNDVPAWRLIVDTDNAYLRENFTVNGQPDLRFIGEGFIPVSAADEARAAKYLEQGDSAAAESYRGSSDMDSLRRRLRDLIERESGPRHVAEIATAAHAVLGPLVNVIQERLQEERLPVEQAQSLLSESNQSLEIADAAILRISDELQKLQRTRVQAAARPFGGLARHLHSKLDDEIRNTDIRDKRKANAVEVHRTNVLQEWLEAPGGPSELWAEQIKMFRQDIDGWMRRNLHTGRPALGTFDISKFRIDEYALSPGRKKRTTAQDIVQRTAAVLGISAPVAATATWIGTTLAAGVLIPPAGAVVGGAAVIIVAVQLFKAKFTSLDAMQREWIGDLDQFAEKTGGQFELALGSQLTVLTDAAVRALGDHRTQLAEATRRLRSRIKAPTFRVRQETVDQLSRLSNEGADIAAALDRLMEIPGADRGAVLPGTGGQAPGRRGHEGR